MYAEELTGKVVLITGASSGIGRASALAFAEAGAKVVLADVDATRGAESLSQVTDSGGDGMFVKVDVSRGNEVSSLIRQIIERYNRLDCAFNNAGTAGRIAETADCSEENWHYVIETNLTSVWLCLKYEIRQMREQGAGVIVNMSSVYGLSGCQRGLPAYTASKHGIIGLTRTAAVEYARAGIRVNAICPGAIDTPFRKQLVEITKDDLETAKRYPMGRIGTAKEVANTVVWLCSDAASFMTGSVVVADGGLTA